MDFLSENNFEFQRITRISDLEELSRYEGVPTVSQRLIVLEIMSLLEHPRSSYELYKELRTRFGLRTSYGTIYPWLRQLEKMEIITSKQVVRKDRLVSQQKKRIYKLTELGKSEFKKSLQALDLILRLLQEAFPERVQREKLLMSTSTTL